MDSRHGRSSPSTSDRERSYDEIYGGRVLFPTATFSRWANREIRPSSKARPGRRGLLPGVPRKLVTTGKIGRDGRIRTGDPLLPKPLKGNSAKLSKQRITSILNELSDYAKFTKFPEFAHFLNLLVAFWSQISENDLSDDPGSPVDER
ncbi:MAG TPA: hypothetical protein VJ327_02895 [Patescibacteria group bacterium]|nr:hypothetical protein [Patescibacteria group bacterium]